MVKIIDPDGFIICRACFIQFPRTNQYFSKNCVDKFKLARVCKTCDNKRRSEREKARLYHHHPKRCLTCNEFFWASKACMNRSIKRGMRGGIYCSRKCALDKTKGNFGMKGKSWNGRRKGECNPNAKLDIELVKEIKSRLRFGMPVFLVAAAFNLNYSTVYSIKSNKTWKHV